MLILSGNWVVGGVFCVLVIVSVWCVRIFVCLWLMIVLLINWYSGGSVVSELGLDFVLVVVSVVCCFMMVMVFVLCFLVGSDSFFDLSYVVMFVLRNLLIEGCLNNVEYCILMCILYWKKVGNVFICLGVYD